MRPATLPESSDLAALAARTFPLACPASATPSDISAFIQAHLNAESFAGYIADPRRQVSVATREANLIGYTMLIFDPPADDVARQLTAAPTAELSKIYVDVIHHGGDVAAALLEDAVACVEDRGCAAVWLGTHQENVRAQRFYEKHGFLRVGTKRFHLGSRWEDDFVYERVL